jgi:hypothetical protein
MDEECQMTKTYLHIPVSGKVEPFNIGPDKPEYQQLQDRVGGDIEGVTLPGNDHMFYVNESGRLNDLKLNMLASAMSGQFLVGDVVLTGPVDDEGDNLSVSAGWLSWAKEQS